MAERRMFSSSLMTSDQFLDLPATSQLIYMHLCLQADDDGFVNCPRGVARFVGAKNSDLDTLSKNGYVITFPSGALVITHWHLHNTIRKDRYKATSCKAEKQALGQDKDGVYYLLSPSDNHLATTCQPLVNQVTTKCQPSDNHLATQVRLGKVSIGKVKEPPVLIHSSNSISKSEPEKEVKPAAGKEIDNRQYNYYHAVGYYQNHFHPVANSVEKDNILDLAKTYGENWVCRAIDATLQSDGGKNCKYLAAILRRWKSTGLPEPWKGQPKNKGHSMQEVDPVNGAALDKIF